MRPVRWFFTNKFVHAQDFLQAPMEDRCVPDELRTRLARRLSSANRLAKWRIVLYVFLYSAILSASIALLGEGLTQVTGAAWVQALASIVFLILQIISPLSVLALILLVPLNRTLGLLEADIYVLGMEVVARNVAANGPLPSAQKLVDQVD